MSRVLLLGGSGYIGLAVAQALLRSGNYIVYATTRDAAKTKTLAANEVIPLVGNLSDVDFIKSAIKEQRINVVVDLSQAYQDTTTILETVVAAGKERASALAADKSIGPKLRFVYCSGMWVHGSPQHEGVSDLDVPGTSLTVAEPAKAVAWRPAHEQAVLKARDVLDVAIVRPGTVHGRTSWIWDTYWSAILGAVNGSSTDKIAIPANQDARIGIVHVDDLADAFVKVMDRIGALGDWPVYDIVSETTPLVRVLEEVKRILGAQGQLHYAGTNDNPFLEAMSLATNVSSKRARSELGWVANRTDFVRDLPQLVAAWRTTKE